MRKRLIVILTACAVLMALTASNPVPAQAASLGKTVAKEAGKRVTTKLRAIRQKLGPRHTLKEPRVVERFTNSPKTDAAKGLPKPGATHTFVRKIHPGRKGSAEHLRGDLNIPHPIKQRETITLPAGTRYHERPTRGGQQFQRELVVEGPIPGSQITTRERLKHRR